MRRTLSAAIVTVGLVAVGGLLTGSVAATAGPATIESLRVLQMNLCDSGIAECFTGHSVSEAATVIQADAPDVVTLNEVCRSDVATLDRAMSGVFSTGTVAWVFQAAVDRRTASAFRCLNGQPYGIGLLVHLPEHSRGYRTFDGIYATQDLRDPEERAWVCLSVLGRFDACTTHLASTSATVALVQCRYLMDTALPAVRAGRAGPVVLGGDLNLRLGGAPDVRSCVPSGFRRAGDGGVQYVLATPDFTVRSDRSISMAGTTDHPGLLVALSTTVSATG